MENVSFLIAFIAGIATFLSPCLLPLIPAYISYLTGLSFTEASSAAMSAQKRKEIRSVTLAHALSFVLGFSIVFILLGTSATILGNMLIKYRPVVQKIGGVLIIFFAFVIMGIIKIPFLEKEKKISLKKSSVSLLGSVLVGITFAIAWTPCVGPILGSILVYASNIESVKKGVILLIAFSMGLGIPFILSALAINSFFIYIKRFQKYLKRISIVSGIILMIFGVLLLIGGQGL